ncbi:hypothetical protein C8J57DRAFT_983143, partial [Mycena rebaudengoi]
ALYLAEAEKYDKVLVQGWRDNMDGILIFAGLFSATVTAFIIEGYKTLLDGTTVRLLTQISMQLGESGTGGSRPSMITSSPHFSPSTSALVCNILWFTSLSLGLSCVLLATLLDQWAQDFLHRAELRSAPVIGARIRSYLYYSIRRFDMHAVVITVPLLLQASLFFFFAGLIAFLIPENLVVMGVCSTVPFIFLVIYCVITLLPLRYLDCPYRTPLS